MRAAADSTPPRARRSSLKKRLGCGCLSVVLALVVGLVGLEWFLRANSAHFLGAPAATHGLYEVGDGSTYWLRPGWEGEQTVDGRTTAIHIDARGLRGPEIGPKRPGETRVLVLGDSLVFGHGVADGETIPARLQEHLAAALGTAVVAGNGGVAGHGTRDMALMLERHRDLAPDVVVACTYLGNDFTDDCRRTSAVVEGYLLHGPMARAALDSLRFRWTMRYRTLYLLEQLLVRYAPGLAFDRSQLQQTPAEKEAFAHFPPEDQRFAGLFFDRRGEDELVRIVSRRCRANYEALARVAGGIPVLHVILPTWWHLTRAEWTAALVRQGLDPAAYERGAAQRRLLAIAAALRLRIVDLTPRLSGAPDRDVLWLPQDRHLSAAGCDQVARWLLPEVRRLLGK